MVLAAIKRTLFTVQSSSLSLACPCGCPVAARSETTAAACVMRFSHPGDPDFKTDEPGEPEPASSHDVEMPASESSAASSASASGSGAGSKPVETEVKPLTPDVDMPPAPEAAEAAEPAPAAKEKAEALPPAAAAPAAAAPAAVPAAIPAAAEGECERLGTVRHGQTFGKADAPMRTFFAPPIPLLSSGRDCNCCFDDVLTIEGICCPGKEHFFCKVCMANFLTAFKTADYADQKMQACS